MRQVLSTSVGGGRTGGQISCSAQELVTSCLETLVLEIVISLNCGAGSLFGLMLKPAETDVIIESSTYWGASGMPQ